MPLTLMSTTANRELEGNADRLLSLVQGYQFERVIDPFCGSGSFTFEAMRRNMAKQYIVCDAYPPIIDMHKTVQVSPDDLKKAYLGLCNTGLGFFTQHPIACVEKLENEKDPCKRAALWIFLSNRLLNNRPLFAGEKIVSQLNLHSALSQLEIFKRIDQTNKLFSQQKVTFMNMRASDFFMNLQHLTSKDFVILDPPYPGCDDPKNSIFYRPEDDKKLYLILMDILNLLNQKGVRYIFNYGIFWGYGKQDKNYFIDAEALNLHELVLVSENHADPQFKLLIERIYVSKNIELSMKNLPQGFVPFSIIEKFDYEHAKECILEHLKKEAPLRSRL